MSKKKDPIVGVMEFFEGANLEAAQSALALAGAIVKRRTPPVEKKTRRTRRTVAPVAPGATPGGVSTPPLSSPPMAEREYAGPSAGPTAVVAPQRRRRRTGMPAEPPSPATSQPAPSLALPGLGPATIGD